MFIKKIKSICETKSRSDDFDENSESEKSNIDGVIDVPEVPEGTRCNLRQFLVFVGPGFLMSIAYLDPGNIESDLRSGSLAGFNLLWVLLTAHILGLLLQRLAARLGVVSGLHLAEVAYEYYPKAPRILLWIMMEITIIAADMQEVIGSAIALNLLSLGHIPLWAGVIVTIVDTLTFLLLDRYGLRKLEFLFCFLISVMAVTFGTEYVFTSPNQLDVVKGTFIPKCGDECSSEILLQAVGIVGAVIMPHNLYLHSGLVKSRKVNRTKKSAISRANFYFFIESAIALGASFVINLFVVSVFASGLHGKTNSDVASMCLAKNQSSHDLFPNDTEPVSVDIYSGGIFLGCAYGSIAMYVWAIGILAAGQSSTMAGCYAGQFVMEGFLKLGWKRWKRVLFSRSIAIVPTLLVAIFQDVEKMTGMNDSLNALMMMQLPFALLPIITFTASERIMKEFRLSIWLRSFVFFIAMSAITINLYFLFTFIYDKAPRHWAVFLGIGVLMVLYFLYVSYLTIYCIDALGFNCLIRLTTCCNKMFPINEKMRITAPWVFHDQSQNQNREKSAVNIAFDFELKDSKNGKEKENSSTTCA